MHRTQIYESSAKSIRELQACQKPPEIETLYGRLVLRKISIYITYLLVRTKVSANQVTIASTVIGASGGIALAFGGYLPLIGVLLLQFSSVLDCVDGELARHHRTYSLSGRFLDLISHNIIIPFVFFGLAFGAYYHSGNAYLFVFGLLAASFARPLGRPIKDQLILRQLLGDAKSQAASSLGRQLRNALDASPGAPEEEISEKANRVQEWVNYLWFSANITNFLTITVVFDLVATSYLPFGITDALYVAYGVASPVVKLGGLVQYTGSRVDKEYTNTRRILGL